MLLSTAVLTAATVYCTGSVSISEYPHIPYILGYLRDGDGESNDSRIVEE